jgi:SAM-dependent methyltransferase
LTAPGAYRRFWATVGDTFPDLDGAASTAFYRANEERLLREHLGPLDGCRLLKTDLWDEAKNTRILHWAAAEGARAHGIDISEPIVRTARKTAPASRPLHAAVADCRAAPFRDASFDAIYSMGTIEHFDESESAVREMWRVLRPGGRAVVGVPNRRDPFLRPLLVSALSAAGLYGYGFEKSYTRGALRAMMTRAGFDVVAETGILFIPGWLRMLDLACHAYAPPLQAVTSALVRPFVWIDRRSAAVRRHGYLIVAVGVKPQP